MTLSAGAGTLSVRSIDAANNTTAGTGHSYTLDATPPSETFPTVTLTSDTGASNATSSPAMAGCILPARLPTPAAPAIASVQVFNGATLLGTATVVAGNWSLDTTLAAGTYNNLKVTVTDLAGNASTTTNAQTIIVDATPPSGGCDGDGAECRHRQLEHDFITSVALQTVSGTFTGALGAGEKIQVSADGGATWVDATAGSGTWSASGVTLSAGTGTLSVRSIDTAGNTTAGTGHSYTLQTTGRAAVATVTALSADSGCLGLRLHYQCGIADGERDVHRHAGSGREDPGECRRRRDLGGCDGGFGDVVGERGDAVSGQPARCRCAALMRPTIPRRAPATAIRSTPRRRARRSRR